MLTCPPCDDKPATGTNALTSIHVFNDFHRNGSDIITCEGEKVSTGVYGVRRLCQNRTKRSRGPSCDVFTAYTII